MAGLWRSGYLNYARCMAPVDAPVGGQPKRERNELNFLCVHKRDADHLRA